MDRFYDGAGSLFVEAYDAFCGDEPAQIAGDVAFYRRLAEEASGRSLELGCGTGRITLSLAESGVDIIGVDVSAAMLAQARRKVAGLPSESKERIGLVEQDMSLLDLGEQFGFAFIPFRSFQHLLTVELQQQCLIAIRRHLRPAGRLALHLFDPRLDLLIDERAPSPRHSGTHPVTGRRYIGEVLQTRQDHLAQVRQDLWRYAEIDAEGAVLREDTREMALRWTYRWELRHLLQLCGFAVEAEFSDFAGTAPVYGRELIVIANAA